METTYIIDNNGEWSDHAIYFVRTSKPVELVEQVVSILGYAILGQAEKIEWRSNTDTAPLEQLVWIHNLVFQDGTPHDSAKKLPTSFLESVLAFNRLTETHKPRIDWCGALEKYLVARKAVEE